jgi:hypothetical protein
MAFKITRTPTYKVPVKVEIPNEKGKKDVETITAIFNRIGLERLNELKDVKHPEVLREVLAGWEGVVDDDGEEVPFTEANRLAMFDIPQAFDALVAAFWNSIFGAKKGN